MKEQQAQLDKLTSTLTRQRKSLWLLAVSGVLLLAGNIYQYEAFSKDHIGIKEQELYPLIDPSRHLIAQSDFIVNIQLLREKLIALVQEAGKDSISLYFEFLNTGANISINPQLSVWPASLPKVPLAMAVMKKIELKQWSLDSELVFSEQDRDEKFGDLWQRPIGTRFTIEELLQTMLTKSDNTAYRILLRNIDFNELGEVINELGIEGLFTTDGKVSAKEYSRLFRSLYVSSFLNRESSQKILSWLGQAEFKDFLSSGLPADVIFSHKFGIDRDVHAYLDSGIVYSDGRPYLISVAIQGDGHDKEEEQVKYFMKQVSKIIYDYVSQK